MGIFFPFCFRGGHLLYFVSYSWGNKIKKNPSLFLIFNISRPMLVLYSSILYFDMKDVSCTKTQIYATDSGG